jgi:hypothetical protein
MIMRHLIPLALFVGLVVSPCAGAATIAVFSNTRFVDIHGVDGYPGEATAIAASLTSMGHSVTTFSGFTATDFTRVAGSANLIVFPEFEIAALDAALDAAATAALRAYVLGGGGVVVAGTFTTRDVDLLNKVFGFSLVDADLALAHFELHDSAAAGTPFANGPGNLLFNSDTTAVAAGSLPNGALNLYSGVDVISGIEDVVVFVANAGVGKVGYLGWDWFNARPAGSDDGGWLAVLDRMVLMTAGAPIDIDADDDGVPDTIDECPSTPTDVVVNEHGCSIEQLVPCARPLGGDRWKNHGEYLHVFKAVADSFYLAQLIDASERDEAVRRATHSSCGKK